MTKIKTQKGSTSYNPYSRQAMATEAQLHAYDQDIDSLVVEYLDDDKDWLHPGDLLKRPATYSSTWASVYHPVTMVSVNGVSYKAVMCEEGSSCTHILLSGTNKELTNNGSVITPALKPPICHVIPWVMINLVMTDWDRAHPTKVCSPEFRRFACWGITSNLRTGHAACNLRGLKTKVGNYRQSEYDDAENHVDKAENAYGRQRYS